jgi:hypothetical protein
MMRVFSPLLTKPIQMDAGVLQLDHAVAVAVLDSATGSRIVRQLKLDGRAPPSRIHKSLELI